MPLHHGWSQLAVWLFAVALAAGQNTRPLAGPETSTSTPDTNKSKPSAGIPRATAEQRKKDDPADRRIAQRIRLSLTQDKSLSVYAHNVIIVCQNGMVGLRGAVRSEAEKQNVEEKAADVVGSNHVASELAVTTAQN
jgi:hyperosmotically inducible protein